MKTTALCITETRVLPLKKTLDKFKANAKIVLNDSLVLNGLKVMKGQFGHFISFPQQKGQPPYTHFEPLTNELRKEIQNSVLREYAKVLTHAGSV